LTPVSLLGLGGLLVEPTLPQRPACCVAGVKSKEEADID
jgi:hypothetical protein